MVTMTEVMSKACISMTGNEARRVGNFTAASVLPREHRIIVKLVK